MYNLNYVKLLHVVRIQTQELKLQQSDKPKIKRDFIGEEEEKEEGGTNIVLDKIHTNKGGVSKRT